MKLWRSILEQHVFDMCKKVECLGDSFVVVGAVVVIMMCCFCCSK